MRSLASTLAILALTTVAFADGEPAEDKPAPDPAAKTPESAAHEDAGPARERKVDANATKKLDAWAEAMHLPVHGTANEVTAHATAGGSIFGEGQLVVSVDWTREKGLQLGVDASEEMKKQLPPEMQKGIRNLFSAWGREALAPAFETPSFYALDYDVAVGKAGDTEYVEFIPFNDRARAELQRLWFAESGLCERRMMIPRVDPSDPMQQMLVGAEIETTYGYEKIGKRHVVTQMSMLTPMGDLQVTYEYQEVTDGAPLMRKMIMVTPFAPDPIEVTFRDYARDGSLVEIPKEGKDEAKPKDGDEHEDSDDNGDDNGDDDSDDEM